MERHNFLDELFGEEPDEEVEILDDDEILSETEDEEIILEFIDDRYPIDMADTEIFVRDALEEYSFEEILDLNEVNPEDALALLYQSGDIGLPMSVSEIENEESEALEDLPEEEVEE